MKFPLFLYMSPESPKWQPKSTKIFYAPQTRAPTDRNTRHPEFRGVQFAPPGLFISVQNNLSTRIHQLEGKCHEAYSYDHTGHLSHGHGLRCSARGRT